MTKGKRTARRVSLRVPREKICCYASLPVSNPDVQRIVERAARAKRSFTLDCTVTELRSLRSALLSAANVAEDEEHLDLALSCLGDVEFRLRLARYHADVDDPGEEEDISAVIDAYVERYWEEVVKMARRDLRLRKKLIRSGEPEAAPVAAAPSRQRKATARSTPKKPRKPTRR